MQVGSFGSGIEKINRAFRVFQNIGFYNPDFKTRVSKLKKFDFKSALFVYGDDSQDNNFKMASSNLPRVSSLSHKGINVKDIISYDKIFIEEKSINKITERLS